MPALPQRTSGYHEGRTKADQMKVERCSNEQRTRSSSYGDFLCWQTRPLLTLLSVYTGCGVLRTAEEPVNTGGKQSRSTSQWLHQSTDLEVSRARVVLAAELQRQTATSPLAVSQPASRLNETGCTMESRMHAVPGYMIDLRKGNTDPDTGTRPLPRTCSSTG